MLIRIPAVLLLTAFALFAAVEHFAQSSSPAEPYRWTKLKTEPFRGKQDDVFFISPEVGWYVNGSGKIYKTIDGGESWVLKLNKPGTYFRAIGFVDERRGFAGNIGTDCFPNVTDTIPLYETSDGG